jgi:hypothetical protein
MFFHFLKFIFDISTSKRSKNNKKFNFKQKKVKLWQKTDLTSMSNKHLLRWVTQVCLEHLKLKCWMSQRCINIGCIACALQTPFVYNIQSLKQNTCLDS